MSELLSRVHARRQAAELGLPWPGTRNDTFDLLLDAAQNGGQVWYEPAGMSSGGNPVLGPWQVSNVRNCDGSCTGCAAIVDLRTKGWRLGTHHMPLDREARPA